MGGSVLPFWIPLREEYFSVFPPCIPVAHDTRRHGRRRLFSAVCQCLPRDGHPHRRTMTAWAEAPKPLVAADAGGYVWLQRRPTAADEGPALGVAILAGVGTGIYVKCGVCLRPDGGRKSLHSLRKRKTPPSMPGIMTYSVRCIPP